MARASALLVLAGLCTLAPLAAASPDAVRLDAPSGADLSARARTHYRQGVDAYLKGRYEQAIGAFIAADLLVPSAALSFDVARAYEKLHDSSNAVIWYRDYLHRSGFIADRAQVEERVAALEAQGQSFRRLSVGSEPSGAQLSLDGRTVGVTPWSGRLRPGSHEIGLRLVGYAPVQKSVSLEPDAALTVQLSLSRPPPVTASGAPMELATTVPPKPADTGAGKRSDDAALRSWGYVISGTGTAAIAGGAVLEILRPRSDSAQASRDTAQHEKTAAQILVGGGVALLVTGGALLVSIPTKPDSPRSPTVAAACGGTGCVASVRGKF